ncbi:hypothetical protein [Lyticum sinuosum]|uniref:Uncharacterized protein n=1 Tax=Lyticum sinuosum TaxID=1332059 RepID=A0AAE4VJM4_9RICK|nr:hypothetical protein [Lyticum sinuosum]MDZ5761046.1 hypothetical protein [Lyticum sinuosum]
MSIKNEKLLKNKLGRSLSSIFSEASKIFDDIDKNKDIFNQKNNCKVDYIKIKDISIDSSEIDIKSFHEDNNINKLLGISSITKVYRLNQNNYKIIEGKENYYAALKANLNEIPVIIVNQQLEYFNDKNNNNFEYENKNQYSSKNLDNNNINNIVDKDIDIDNDLLTTASIISKELKMNVKIIEKDLNKYIVSIECNNIEELDDLLSRISGNIL